MKQFELLFDLIPAHPGLNMAIIDDGHQDCVEKLAKFCESISANLYVKSLINTNLESSDCLHVEQFSFEQARYNRKSIQYDFLFLCANIEDKQKISEIAKKIYRVIKNAANLFMLANRENTDEISQILEETNFVALSVIDIDETFSIVSAKKMHGWTKI